MTITELLQEIKVRRAAMEEKINEVKKMDAEFQEWLYNTIGINEKAPVAPETILSLFLKLQDFKTP
jgi:hypothetical protein